MSPKLKSEDIFYAEPFQTDIDYAEQHAAISSSCEIDDAKSRYKTRTTTSFRYVVSDQVSALRSSLESWFDTTKPENRVLSKSIFTRTVSCPKAGKLSFQARTFTIGTLVYLVSFIGTTVYFHSYNDSPRFNYYKGIVIQTKFKVVGKPTDCSNVTFVSSEDVRRQSSLKLRPMILPPEQKPEPVEWQIKSDVVLEQLQYPIFMPSMPKSGTTSLWKFFLCGGLKASHNWIKVNDDAPSTISGLCIHDNIKNGLPPLQNCGDFDVYTDTGYLTYGHDVGLQCYFPSIEGLEAIYHSYPNATFVHVVRDTKEWYLSLQKWSHSSLFVRFRMCNTIGFPNGQSDANDFYEFYDWHNALIRRFVKDRPSINYIEIKLDDPNAGQILQDRTGISKGCWKQCRPDSVLCEEDKSLETMNQSGATLASEAKKTQKLNRKIPGKRQQISKQMKSKPYSKGR